MAFVLGMPVALLFYIIGAISTLVFILNNIVRTVLRQKQLRVSEIGILFFVVLMPIVALLIDNLQNAEFDQLENLTFLLIIPIAILHIGITIIELFRPQRLRQSRGLMGIGAAILLIASTFSYNVISLRAELNIIQSNPRPTPVNSTSNEDPCAAVFEQIGVTLINDILDEVGLSAAEAFTLIEENPEQSIADLIEANGGSPVVFSQELLEDARVLVRDLVVRGCLTQDQATAAIVGLPAFIGPFIYDDLSELLSQLEEQTDEDLAVDLSEEDAIATREALVAFVEQEPSPLPTITPTPTATITPTPTLTRTPRPTLSPTPTRERFATATPQPTVTLPNPCIAFADFNVNMRTFPDIEESEIVQLIPFEATLTIFAPNDEGTWWFGSYEGESGWISDEFISTTSACNNLPPRQP